MQGCSYYLPCTRVRETGALSSFGLGSGWVGQGIEEAEPKRGLEVPEPQNLPFVLPGPHLHRSMRPLAPPQLLTSTIASSSHLLTFPFPCHSLANGKQTSITTPPARLTSAAAPRFGGLAATPTRL